jgi:hypothetical protein
VPLRVSTNAKMSGNRAFECMQTPWKNELFEN